MKKFMWVILALTFIGGCTGLAFWIIRFCAVSFIKPDPHMWEITFVSESPDAYCYHYSKVCKALSRTTYDIDAMSVEDAEEYDYKPCKLCLEESVRYELDDWGCLLIFPIILVSSVFLNELDKLCRKYKFRNPIVKR